MEDSKFGSGELQPESLGPVTGGVMNQVSKDYILNYIRTYKGMGETREILKTATGWTEEMIKFAIDMWDRVKV